MMIKAILYLPRFTSIKARIPVSVAASPNEVTVFLLPSAIAVAEEAHRSALMAGCLTNAFCSESSARLLAMHMDFINVSLKSSRNAFYRHNLGLPTVQAILRNIRIFAESSRVEIITPMANEVTPEVLPPSVRAALQGRPHILDAAGRFPVSNQSMAIITLEALMTA
jgi:hypothetical protein